MADGGGEAGVWAAMRDFVASLIAYAGRGGPWLVAMVAAGAVLEGLGIVLLVPILGLVLDPAGSAVAAPLAALGLATPSARLIGLLGAFLAVMAVRAVALHRRDVALADLQTGFVEAIRNRAIAALVAAPWQRVVALKHARITNLLGADIGRIAQSTHLLIQGTVAAAMLAIQAAIALALAPIVAGVVVAALAVALLLSVMRTRWARDGGDALVTTHLRLLHDTTGFLGGLKAAIAEDAGGRFAATFADGQAELRSLQLAFVRRQSRGRALFSVASALGAVAVVGGGIALAVPVATLVALVVLFARMARPVATIQSAVQNVAFGLPSFEAVRALQADLGGTAPAIVPRAPPAGAIVLAAARFVHTGGAGIAGASLTIAPGEVIGIVGPSGAGKTTLIDLLAGLIAPQSGEVRVGDVTLDAATRTGWRGQIGYVAQDGFLFHDSVRRNLDPADVRTPHEIAVALAITGGDGVVAGLVDGLDTIVGERGTRLSGGERQRLAIARALLRRPRLLVLDEATSAIDVAGEAVLLDRLLAQTPRPAIVIVAHRSESLRRCDRIVRVVDGRIVDAP